MGSATCVTVRGERLGSAVSRGEITLRVRLPGGKRSGGGTLVAATFLSDRKLSAVLPPSGAPGAAELELVLQHPPAADATRAQSKLAASSARPSAAATPHRAPNPTPYPTPTKATSMGSGLAELAAAALAPGPPSPAAAPAAEADGAAADAGGTAAAAADAAPASPPALREGGLGGLGTSAPPDSQASSALTFRYFGAYSAQKLRPATGPLSGGTAVRVLGSGFVPTGEIVACAPSCRAAVPAPALPCGTSLKRGDLPRARQVRLDARCRAPRPRRLPLRDRGPIPRARLRRGGRCQSAAIAQRGRAGARGAGGAGLHVHGPGLRGAVGKNR